MTEKNIKSRITHKHDIEANWLLAVNFTPKQGEIIIYDIDDNYSYERFKIGDGISNVNILPFGGGNNSVELDETLTQEGMAADAKAVGDALDALDTIIAVDENDDGNIQLRAFMSETDSIITSELTLSSPSGKKFQITIDDGGILTVTEIVESIV